MAMENHSVLTFDAIYLSFVHILARSYHFFVFLDIYFIAQKNTCSLFFSVDFISLSIRVLTATILYTSMVLLS